LPSSFIDAIQTLLNSVRDKLSYTKEMTDVSTAVSKALELGHGVCQDFAHLFIATCRQLGMPARYVSGYVNQPGEIATHAWCQIWCGATVGWIDVDPTRKCFASNDHVLTAVGRDYSDVPPNKGVWKGADARETISVSVSVRSVERVPTDLTELAAPAWTSSSQETRNNSRAFIQQQRRIAYRQQQSQQQQ
jgi:transglutaminase-like putative cysteine protease